MEVTQLLLNDQLVTITADPCTVKKLNDDDKYLSEYVNQAAKMGQFHFLFAKDPTLRRIVVKRVPFTTKQVWFKKGRPSENDTAASILLLKLRNSDKYSLRFKDGHCPKSKLWEELATEMRFAGFDVDGKKCAQKFLQLVQSYQKKGDCLCLDSMDEFSEELKKVMEERRWESEEEDEEWLPKGKKRKKGDDDEEFLKKFLKKSNEQKEERFREICVLIRRRNELLEQKLKQNQEIITMLAQVLN